jgi:PAS domain S-box-containing protein
VAPPRLFLRFALFSGIALVVAVGLALVVARWNANAQAEKRAVGEATAVAKQLSTDDLARTAFDWPRPAGAAGDDLLAFLDDFFSPTVSGHDPPNVVLYSLEGVVTYAVDRSLIGTRAPAVGVVQGATQGPRYTVADDRQDTFVPVTWAFTPGTVRGVMRLERDYRPIAAQIQEEFYFQAATIALALFGLYLAMLPIMRRATRSLRRAYLDRAELAAIVDHSNDAIVAQTPEGVITSWNACAEYVYGWTAAEAVGQRIDILFPGNRPTEPTSELDHTRTTHVRKDGTPIAVAVTVSPIRDAGGDLVGSSMTVRDVTDLERLERELHESHRQEAVGRLAGGIAQDFNGMLNELDAAAANLLLDPSSQRDLEKIRHVTARGSSLVDHLLAVGGIQEASPAQVDLNAAIRTALPELAHLVGPHVEVTTDLEADLGSVLADPEHVAQLIFHLAGNARDSMPAGGRLAIQTANVDFARRAREGDAPGEAALFVMVAFGDTGAALAPEAQERPFEPFFLRSDGGERMALGLAAVCGIVKQSGGTLGVETKPEGGTVYRIYLPRMAAAKPVGAPA